ESFRVSMLAITPCHGHRCCGTCRGNFVTIGAAAAACEIGVCLRSWRCRLRDGIGGETMPRRITVRGTSGVGKTTFSAALARRLGLAFIELDALHHGPNWSAPEAEEFRARVRAAMDAAPDGWVIDGSYDTKLGDTVLGAADTIV